MLNSFSLFVIVRNFKGMPYSFILHDFYFAQLTQFFLDGIFKIADNKN